MAERKNSKKTSAEQEEQMAPFFTPQRIQSGLGIGLIVFAVILFIAYISYFFTWGKDQSLVLDFSWKIIFSKSIVAANAMGRLGAWLSHVLFYDLFGIASIAWIFLLFVTGFNHAFQTNHFKLLKWLIHTILFTILAVLVAKFLKPAIAFPLGGGLGNMLYDWISTLIGRLGLGIILLLATSSYLYLIFKEPLQLLIAKIDNVKVSNPIEKVQKKGSSIKDLFKNLEDDEGLDIDQNENIGGESLIPEEKIPPVPHFDDDTYDILRAQELKDENDRLLEFEVNKQASKKLIDNDLEINTSVKETVLSNIDTVIERPNMGLDTLFDPTLELSHYEYPIISLLDEHGDGQISINREELEKNKNQIVDTLRNYNIEISKIKATVGPTVTLYEIVPAPGIRISKIKNLEDDIALSLAALGIRIIAPIPGKGTIGIEVPNIKKSIVSMKSLLSSEKFVHSDFDLPVALGKTIANENYIIDLAKMPHLLMAGATGQGKSVGLNALLVSLLYKKHPSELKLILVDPKKVELTLFKKIENHFLAKLPNEEEAIITDTKKVIYTLNALCIEMDNRYNLLKAAEVRHIKEYNQKFKERKLNPNNGHKFLPYIVLVVDEFADLMMTAGKEIETPIARLAQLARAIGIHLVIATQRPSVNIITGTIKANFPGRIAFKVSSKIDSRTILDAGGADQLIGRGDMLLSVNGDIVRLQCPFVDTPEVERIANFIEAQQSPPEAYMLPEYVDPNASDSDMDDDFLGDKDPMFEDAARLIVMHQIGSTSLIQRKMKLGYNRAGRLMDQLEAAGIVGQNLGSKAREVKIHSVEELEQILQTLR
jgi:S-DNA-T family DNA segregation ATPase FtsK/SpoIIIE